MTNPNFILPLQRSRRKHDSVWQILDRMTKLTKFFRVNNTHSPKDYAKLYLQEVVRLHAVFLTIILDRDEQFTAQFWKLFQKGSGSKVNLCTIFHS